MKLQSIYWEWDASGCSTQSKGSSVEDIMWCYVPADQEDTFEAHPTGNLVRGESTRLLVCEGGLGDTEMVQTVRVFTRR